MGSMIDLAVLVWPSWALRDLWRWMLIGLGVAVIFHSLFSKNMRIRHSSSLYGLWRGRLLKKPWQILLMRSFFVILGACCIASALRNCQEISISTSGNKAVVPIAVERVSLEPEFGHLLVGDLDPRRIGIRV